MLTNVRSIRRILIAIVCLDSLVSACVHAQSVQWIQQFGTSLWDTAAAVSADEVGNLFVAGETTGSLAGPNAGNWDLFVRKYDALGTIQWTRQLGSNAVDRCTGMSTDHLGNVFISGSTSGSLGGPSSGQQDAFVSKYSANGSHQWTRQFGTSSDEQAGGVTTDGLGNIYVTGSTYGSLGGSNIGNNDVFVRKYNSSGTLQWTRQFGTTALEGSNGISADSFGNVFVAGSTRGNLGGPNSGNYDAFVRKYNADGVVQWTRQIGTSFEDYSRSISADDLGSVFVSGYTYGSLGGAIAGEYDAFLSKYDADGTIQWSRQFGTAGPDLSNNVSADGLGNAYISGVLFDGLNGSSAGDYNAFVNKYGADGALLWTRIVGSSSFDGGRGVAADGFGNVYLSGETTGNLGQPVSGDIDAFVAKISLVPEPATWLIFLSASMQLLVQRTRCRASYAH